MDFPRHSTNRLPESYEFPNTLRLMNHWYNAGKTTSVKRVELISFFSLIATVQLRWGGLIDPGC